MFADSDQKRWYRFVLFWLAACACFLHEGSRADAAGAKVAIETESATVVKGEYFYIIVTVTSADEIGGFEGYFSYEQSVMKYITGGTVSSGNDDAFTISDTEREQAGKRVRYSIRFLARKAGVSTVELRSPYAVYGAGGQEKMSVASNSLNICVISRKKARKQGLLPADGTLPMQDGAGDPPQEIMPEDGAQTEAEGMPPQEALSATHQSVSLEDDGVAGYVEGQPEGSPHGEDQAEEPPRAEGKISGPSRMTCIAVIFLACVGLAAIAFCAVQDYKRDYFAEPEDDFEEEIQENDLYRETDPIHNEMEDEVREEPEQSMEEIERRLEQKREWLRKGY